MAGGGALWVPSRSDAVDPTGFPTMEALRTRHRERDGHDGREPPAASTSTVSRPTARACGSRDNTEGVVYRVPLSG